MLECLEQNFNVFTYSGELLDSEFQYWIDLQAAGSDNVVKKISKKGKEYYDATAEAKKQIHGWYKDKFYLYKNNESMQFKDILTVVEAFRIHKQCDVIFLDNFLTMDISDLDDKELKAQTIFINSLASYCKEKQVLVFLVIHPKKIYKGICTKGDVLGSGNLTNAIDYLFLVHRNNEAWKTAMKDRAIGPDAKDYLLKGTNIVEVSKDRWTGSEGLNVPLIYYEDSKRLVDINNTASADKKYSWDKSEAKPKYNEYLKRHFKAVTTMDDNKIPLAQRESWIPNYQKVLNELNFILSLFDTDKVKYSFNEAMGGFDTETVQIVD
jgi:hypothetical protein